jgi:hypothetical protein
MASMTTKDVQYYENAIAAGPNKSEVETLAKEIEEILVAMKKGLEILKKTGRNPETLVLENQKKFNSLLEKIKKQL